MFMFLTCIGRCIRVLENRLWNKNKGEKHNTTAEKQREKRFILVHLSCRSSAASLCLRRFIFRKNMHQLAQKCVLHHGPQYYRTTEVRFPIKHATRRCLKRSFKHSYCKKFERTSR